jgi:hypothetical protein
MNTMTSYSFFAALVVSCVTFANVNTAQAAPGCLDVNQSDPRGPDGKGRNVILWKCNGGKNQGAKWVDKIGTRTNPAKIVFNIDGKSFCLATVKAEATGDNKAGFNVIAWPDCSITPKWFKDSDKIRYTLQDGREFCLDVNEADKTGANGDGRNVIIWPECHGRQNQRWNFGVSSSGSTPGNTPDDEQG